MKIHEWAQDWQNGLVAELIELNQTEKFIIEATREYQAWGFLHTDNAQFNDQSEWTFQAALIDRDTELTISEWGVIAPLAKLFAERESALIQESLRLANHEPYGRNSSEINQDITNYRHEYLRRWAFSMPVLTI